MVAEVNVCTDFCGFDVNSGYVYFATALMLSANHLPA